jgi:hypothetical protein
MSKHTPGPWTVAPTDKRAVFTGQHAKPIMAPNIADAQLIAAAPDMAEALRAVADKANMRSFLPVALLDKINAALAKAGVS